MISKKQSKRSMDQNFNANFKILYRKIDTEMFVLQGRKKKRQFTAKVVKDS